MNNNGFYIWKKNECETNHPLNLDQVVQVIEGAVWVTGVSGEYDIETSLMYGSFGVCVMDDDGIKV